jgi:hypothetical protein
MALDPVRLALRDAVASVDAALRRHEQDAEVRSVLEHVVVSAEVQAHARRCAQLEAALGEAGSAVEVLRARLRDEEAGRADAAARVLELRAAFEEEFWKITAQLHERYA